MGYFLEVIEIFGAKAVLFGAKPTPPQPTLLGGALLIVALVVAALVGWWNWREAHEEPATDSPEELLASFEQAHAAGEIDDEEFKRLRERLTGSAPRLANKPDDDGKHRPK